MAMTYALIHEENGVFGISFPDFPGCVSGGDTAEDALRRGRGALAFHIAGMAADGDAMPRLRGLDELRADRAFRADAKDAVVALVEVDLPGKAVRLNISLDEHLVERIDADAKAAGETRSGWLTTASKMRLGEGADVRAAAPVAPVPAARAAPRRGLKIEAGPKRSER